MPLLCRASLSSPAWRFGSPQRTPQRESRMSDEQRFHDRVVVNHEFESIDSFLTEYVSNISHGGVFIRSRSPLPVGTRVELRFTIIVDDVESIEGQGEVVRVVEGSNGGMGVAFTALEPKSEALINELMERGNGNYIVVLEEDGSVDDASET